MKLKLQSESHIRRGYVILEGESLIKMEKTKYFAKINRKWGIFPRKGVGSGEGHLSVSPLKPDEGKRRVCAIF